MKLKSIPSRTVIHDGGLDFLNALAGVTAPSFAAPIMASASDDVPAAASATRALSRAPASSAVSAAGSDLPGLAEIGEIQPSGFQALTASEIRTDLPARLQDAGLITADTSLALHQWDAPVTETLRLETVFLENYDRVQGLDPTDLGPPLDVRGEMRGHDLPRWLPDGLFQDRWDIDL